MPSASLNLEAETIPGLEDFASDELLERFGERVSRLRCVGPGCLRFRYRGDPAALLSLRAVIAIYQIHHFAIPRPRAWLGHEHFTRLCEILRQTATRFPAPPLSFGIGAAGSHSPVMRRLRSAVAAALDLTPAVDDKGDLFMRLLPSARGSGWEALVRATPLPLSKRAYRLADVPGALNATAAYAMTRVGVLPCPSRAVNLCSGSSTILIEHGLTRPGDQLIAIDSSADMLAMGRQNAAAASVSSGISHLRADARATPLPSGWADRLYADLPFGHHIGSHTDNLRLYPALLREASRIASASADFVVLTHELRLLRRCLAAAGWQISEERAINLRGLHPRLFVLRRNSARIGS